MAGLTAYFGMGRGVESDRIDPELVADGPGIGMTIKAVTIACREDACRQGQRGQQQDRPDKSCWMNFHDRYHPLKSSGRLWLSAAGF